MFTKPNTFVKAIAAVAVAGALSFMAPTASYAGETASRPAPAATTTTEEPSAKLASSLNDRLAADPALSSEVQAAASQGDTTKVAGLLGLDPGQVDVVDAGDQQLDAARVIIVRVTCRQIGNVIICRITVTVYD